MKPDLRATLERYLSLRYPVIFTEERGEEGEIYIVATHPDLPGCMSDGATRKEAAENLADARRGYIETMLEDGVEPPSPLP